MSVTLTLEDEIDLSRGDMLVSPDRPPSVARNFEAMVVWFNEQPLVLERTYMVKHTVHTSRAKATAIRFRVNMRTLERDSARELKMNDIAAVEFESATPLFFDPYDRNRTTGSFILIDPLSNATVGAAMIGGELPARTGGSVGSATGEDLAGTPLGAPVSAEDRTARHGHAPAVLVVQGRANLAAYLERALFAEGFEAVLVSAADVPAGHLETLLRISQSAGLVVILAAESASPEEKLRWKALAADRFFDLAQHALPPDDAESVPLVLSLVCSLRTDRNPSGGAA